MAKARILKVINFRQEDLPTLKELEAVLKREGKEFSEWARQEASDYVKKHGAGNPIYPLETFSDSKSIALPTAWEDPTPDKLHDISAEEAKFMVGQMSKWYPELQRKAKQ